ncbi:MAG TPA: hypothetical protein VL371_23780 [Gemmataceae bacterium]|nr:hypothetical protein [Gemmataceae bacterium]
MDRTRPPTRKPARTPEGVRPWPPWQMLTASLVFGAAAGGAATGFNFVRLGKRQYLIPCIVAGWTVMVVAIALLMFAVPDHARRPVAVLINLAAGMGFMLAQQAYFDIWKAVNWSPHRRGGYRPNGRGQFLLVCLGTLGMEFGLIELMGFLAEGLR